MSLVRPHPSETAALSLIADGAPLAAALECLATLAESTIPGGRAIVLTADESSGAKLNLSDEAAADEESDQPDDNGSIEALARELKGQRWDADKSVWK